MSRLMALALLLSLSVAPSALATPQPPVAVRTAPTVVAIVGELGANLLHGDFQMEQPITAIAGAPRASEVALPRNGDFETRLAQAKAGPLGAVSPKQLLHVGGTNVFVFNATSEVVDVLEERKHGSAVLGAAASSAHGTAPRSAYVLVLGSTDAWAWTAEQQWIDVVSSSFYSVGIDCPTGAEVRRTAAGGKPVLVAGGNNTAAELLSSPSGLGEVIRVGGVEPSGRASAYATRPYEVGDQFTQQLPAPDALTGTTFASGTSFAAPRAAGRVARLIELSRGALHDSGSGVRKGRLAVAPEGAKVPPGLLSDRSLDAAELRHLLQSTATPMEPDGPTRYWVEGFGALGEPQMRLATSVLLGQRLAPDRAAEQAQHDRYLALAALANGDLRCGHGFEVKRR